MNGATDHWLMTTYFVCPIKAQISYIGRPTHTIWQYMYPCCCAAAYQDVVRKITKSVTEAFEAESRGGKETEVGIPCCSVCQYRKL